MRILCIIIFFSLCSYKEACSSIDIEIEPGLDGFYRTQQWFPLKAILNNDGQNINGILSTTFSGMKYELPIDLPAKSRKKVFFYLYPTVAEHEIKISLHSNKSLIIDAVSKIKELDQNIIFIGILSGSNLSQSYSFLEDGEYPVRVINFNPENLPEEWAGYDSLDIIITDNLNPDLLTVDQKKAFKNWLFSGGKLLLYGHYPHPLDADFYEDLLPVNVFQTIVPEGNIAYDNKQEPYINPSGLLLNDKTLKKDCKIIKHFNGTPVMVKTDYGMGEIIYSTIPFYLPILSELAKDKDIRNALLSHNNRPYQQRKLSISRNLSENISIDEDKLLLSGKYILYFLIVYIGSLIVLYFTVFKKKNSFAFNVITLIFFPVFFTALFATMLFLFRGHNVRIDNFSLLIGSDQFKERILSKTFCILSAQKQKNLEIGLRNPSFIIESSNKVDVKAINPYTLSETEYPALRNISLNPLENNTFFLRGFLESDDFIDANISWNENLITGSISNTSQCNFRHCIIMTADSYYELPDLEAQATIDLSSELHKGAMDKKSLSKKEKQFYDLIEGTLFKSVIRNRYPVIIGWSSEPVLSYSLNEEYFINKNTSLFVYFL